MVGVPGSGKSHVANSFPEPKVVLSTDDVFTSGEHYLWTPDGLGIAHKLNQLKCYEACRRGIPLVIIDNCNIREEHRKPYIEIAAEFGYSVEIVEPNTEWKYDAEQCFARNTHSVPLSTIQKMIGALNG